MAATAAQIAQLRRMCGLLVGDITYTDTVLGGYIEAYPLLDERGEQPYTWDSSTEPPTQDANDSWVATYDLNAAAADVWEERASALAANYDFSADGASFSRSQAYEQYMSRVRYHRSRRSAKTATLVKWPDERDNRYPAWIGNAPEPRDDY
jgi:hypothetical protein